MITVIYNKITLQPVGTLASNETVEQGIEEAVSNFEGTVDDYAALDSPFDYFKIEVVDGVAVAVEIPKPPEQEVLTPIERLERENAELRVMNDELKNIVTTVSADLESFLNYYFTSVV